MAGGLALAGLHAMPLSRVGRAVPATTIRMRSDPAGEIVMFDPVGLFVMPGTTVRWVVELNVHTATAYHPANGDYSQRIPDGAAPWDSGYLIDPGNEFAITLTVEGVYDYFCRPHEAAGMVGRIVVGRPAGPGAMPPGDELPAAARSALPPVEEIMKHGSVSPI